MSQNTLELAEIYLDEMLAAEAARDYAGFTQRFEAADLTDFGPETFSKEIQEVHEDLGAYQSRRFLGVVENNWRQMEGATYRRYVWDGAFEKGHCVLIVGMHERDGVCYVHEFMNH